jgi:glyoxylase-like metal-dependent hydrolase (beta-lactamase superfamily II)
MRDVYPSGSWWLALLVTTALLTGSLDAQPPGGPGGQAVLDRAAALLGVDRVRTLELSGRGADFLFGQHYDGDSAWPRFNLPLYRLSIDFGASAVREQRTRTQGQNPPLGGGNQPIPEQRQVWSATRDLAWNGDGDQASPAGRERDGRPALVARQLWILLTPQGFVGAARREHARVEPVVRFGSPRWQVSFPFTGGTLTGWLDDDGHVERIETWLSSPVLGDTQLTATFGRYQDAGGIQFPDRLVHSEGGFPILDVAVTGIIVNPTVTIAAPSQLRGERADRVGSPVLLSPGVWSVPLGPRDRSVVIEFRDYLVVVEAPSDEATSLAAIAAIRAAIPGKPIRYIVNTHPHFDHSGGLRAYAAIGATVLTHRDNVAYFQQTWSNPWSLAPDTLARSGRQPVFEPVVGARTLTDGTRTIVIHHYAGNMHHPGMLLVYLPAERAVIEADSFNPPNVVGEQPNALPNLVQFLDVIDRLRLDVEHVVPVHGRLSTIAEARQAVAQYGDSVLWPSPEGRR